MSTTIDELIYRIAGDAAELKKELRQVETTAQQTGKKAGDGLNSTLGSGMDRLTRQAVKLAAAVGAIFTVRAGIQFVKGAIDSADALAKLSQRTGVAVEDLSTLRHAAKLTDTSLEGIAKSLNILSRNMFDARKGSGEAATLFQKLGIATTNADGSLRKATDVMAEVADLFAAMPDGADKTALAMRLFGRAGAELIPLLNAGSRGIREMTEEARRLGLEISTETARAAEQFNDDLTRLKSSAIAFGGGVVEGLVPALSMLASTFAKSGTSARGAGVVIGQFFAETLADVLELSIRVGSEVERLSNAIRNIKVLSQFWADTSDPSKDQTGPGLKLLFAFAKAERERQELEARRARALQYANDVRNAIIRRAQEGGGGGPSSSGGMEAERARAADILKSLAESSGRQVSDKAKAIQLQDDYLRLLEEELGLELKLAEARENEQRQSLEGQERQLEELRLRQMNTEAEKALWMTTEGRFRDWDDWAKRMYIANAKLIDQAREQAEMQEKIAATADRMERWVRGEGPSPFKEEMNRISVYAEQGARNIQSTFAQFLFEPFEEGLKGMGDAFRSILRRMIAEALAAAILSRIFGPLSRPGETGFVATFFNTLAGVQRRAGGGPIHGPGTETSDDVLIRASRGEYVMRASAVRHYGLEAMERINRIRAPRFADGGLVPAPIRVAPAPPLLAPAAAGLQGGQQGGPLNLKIINAFDGRVVHDEMASSAGERVFLNVARKNARALAQILRNNG